MTATRSTSPLVNLLARLPWRGQDARFQHLLEQLKEAAFVVVPRTGQFVTINGRATALTGWMREELLTQLLAEIITVPEILARFYSLEPGDVRYLQDVPIRTHQNRIVRADMRLSALDDGAEVIVLVLATAVEDRLAQERERLQQAHVLARLDLLLPLFEAPTPETLPEAVAIVREVMAADAAGLYSLQPNMPGLHFTCGDGISERFPKIVGPSEAHHLQALFVWSSAHRGEGFLSQAFRAAGWVGVVAHPLGEPPNIVGSLFVAYRAGNAPSSKAPTFIGILAHQLTHLMAQIARQAKLNDAQRLAFHLTHQLAAINAQIGEGVVMVNALGTVDDLNPAAAQMLGYRAEDVIGLPFGDVLAADDGLLALIQAALDGQSPPEKSGRMHRRSGEAFPAMVRARPLPAPNGGGVLVLRDLSQARADELHREHLDHMAYVGQSSQAFAHEVRAPLHNISMGVQYLAARLPAEDALQPQLAKIQSETARLSNLMNDMLAWAKPIDPAWEPTDLSALLKRLLVRWSAKLQQRNIQPTFAPLDPSPPVMADQRLIERVFVNLIENALQAMPAGGHLAIKLMKRERGPSEKFVEARVSDSGPGIPDEYRKRIFDPYFTTRADGTGLGLAICKRIITIHRGAISVESFPGTGTIFTVTLPVYEETLNHQEHEEARSTRRSSS
jgi:two-component system nitrogen regulation sensor histidine kinase GlnL